MTAADRPLLSIIVPTKDRYSTLAAVVTSILGLVPDPRLEVVVQDNSASNEAAGPDIVESPDARLRYEHQPVPVSIVDNTERAIDRARGEYLLFIGDDDIVVADVLRDVERLARSGLRCLAYTPAYYWWGNVTFHKSDFYKRPNALCLPRGASAREEVLRSVENRRMVLANGAISYYRLPRFYHGIVHRSVLEAIRERTGTYVPGASPDMALSLAISFVLDEYLYVNHPVTVFGASRSSGGGRTMARDHHGRIEEQKHLPPGIAARWSEKLPRYWSEYTIYPQTAMEVLRAFGSSEAVGFEATYASLMINESWLARLAWPYVVRHCGSSPVRWGRWARFLARRTAGRVLRRFRALVRAQDWDVAECRDPAACMEEIRRRAAAAAWYEPKADGGE
jgi:hypothetical protein